METCKHCGKTWGVTTPPNEDIACHDCQFRRPDLYPVRYWEARLASYRYLNGPALKYRSVSWWDYQASVADLETAVVAANAMTTEEKVTIRCPIPPHPRAAHSATTWTRSVTAPRPTS